MSPPARRRRHGDGHDGALPGKGDQTKPPPEFLHERSQNRQREPIPKRTLENEVPFDLLSARTSALNNPHVKRQPARASENAHEKRHWPVIQCHTDCRCRYFSTAN